MTERLPHQCTGNQGSTFLVIKRGAHRQLIHTITSCCKHHTPIYVRTVVVQLAGWQICFIVWTSKACLVLFPRLPLSVMLLSGKTFPTHIPGLKLVPHENHAFPWFGNSSICYTRMACKLGRGAFTEKRDRGRHLCDVGAVSAFLDW